MKYITLLTVFLTGLWLTGCAHPRPAPVIMMSNPTPTIVTPSDSQSGKVVAFNAAGRFVVLNFPSAPLPKMDQKLFLYRAGLKVAEIRITGPESDDNTVADVVTGDAQVGDEVRNQ